MKRAIYATIVENVFRRHVHLCVTKDRAAATKFFANHGMGGEVSEVGAGCLGKTVFFEQIGDVGDDTRHICVWLYSRDDISVLAHELVHVVTGTLYSRGVRFDPGNDETFAYLYQFLFCSAMRLLGYGNLVGIAEGK